MKKKIHLIKFPNGYNDYSYEDLQQIAESVANNDVTTLVCTDAVIETFELDSEEKVYICNGTDSTLLTKNELDIKDIIT